MVTREQLEPGKISEKVKDACEYAHYALTFHEPIDKHLVLLIARDHSMINVFPIVDEAEYNRCQKHGKNYQDIYKKPGHREHEVVLDDNMDLNEEGFEEGDFGEADDEDSEHDDDFVNTQTEEQARTWNKKWAAGDQNKYAKGPKERINPNEKRNYKAGHNKTEHEKKTSSEKMKDYEYKSNIDKDSDIFNIFKEDNIHKDNLRKEFKDNK